MGEAKRRGSFEKRKAEALEAGRKKKRRLSNRDICREFDRPIGAGPIGLIEAILLSQYGKNGR